MRWRRIWLLICRAQPAKGNLHGAQAIVKMANPFLYPHLLWQPGGLEEWGAGFDGEFITGFLASGSAGKLVCKPVLGDLNGRYIPQRNFYSAGFAVYIPLQKVMSPRFFRSLAMVALSGFGALSISIRAETIIRLAPAVFAKLPSHVRSGLVRNGCLVPQSFLAKEPENAIAGSFTRKGSREWAVLCSANGVSSILIFGVRSQEPLSRIAESPDDTYIQVIGEGRTGFSRRISAVSSPTPGLTAIDDAFLEKASIVWIRRGRHWLETAGAD